MIVQNSILWQKSLNNGDMPTIMIVNLGIWTFLFVLTQTLASLKLSIMLIQAKVSRLKTVLTLVLLWTVCVCVIVGCSLKDMDWPD